MLTIFDISPSRTHTHTRAQARTDYSCVTNTSSPSQRTQTFFSFARFSALSPPSRNRPKLCSSISARIKNLKTVWPNPQGCLGLSYFCEAVRWDRTTNDPLSPKAPPLNPPLTRNRKATARKTESRSRSRSSTGGKKVHYSEFGRIFVKTPGS